MAVNKNAVQFGIAKQSAKGSAVTNPAFAHGVMSGKPLLAVKDEPDELTSGTRAPAAAFRGDVESGFEYATRAYPASIGLFTYAALGTISSTGTASPYTHVVTQGDTLPYLTVFEKISSDIFAVQDCKVDELELKWEGNKPLEVSVKLPGGVSDFGAGFTVSGTDETGDTDFLTPVGGTFKIDLDTGTAATADIKGGSIKFGNNLATDYFSGVIEASDQSEGGFDCEVSFTIKPTVADWLTLITGDASGTAVAGEPVYGSFEMTFATGANSLKVESTRCQYALDFFDADPKGDSWEGELVGKCYYSSGTATAPVRVTIVNSTASY